jgi:hypothetical protein
MARMQVGAECGKNAGLTATIGESVDDGDIIAAMVREKTVRDA